MDNKGQGKAVIGIFSMIFALGAFFYVSNEQFKEEMKQVKQVQLSPKYQAGSQVAAACSAYLERQ